MHVCVCVRARAHKTIPPLTSEHFPALPGALAPLRVQLSVVKRIFGMMDWH